MSDQAKREIVYWDCDETADTLEHETIDDAIEARLEGLGPDKEPGTIKVYGWARKVITPDDFPSPLELIMDRIAEDDGGLLGEAGPDDKITDAMLDAEKVFLNMVAREFVPWACEIVETRTVNVAEWIKANRPEWTEE